MFDLISAKASTEPIPVSQDSVADDELIEACKQVEATPLQCVSGPPTPAWHAISRKLLLSPLADPLQESDPWQKNPNRQASQNAVSACAASNSWSGSRQEFNSPNIGPHATA